MPVPLKVVMDGIWAENIRGKVQDILILLQELAFIVAYIDKAGIDVVRAMGCC